MVNVCKEKLKDPEYAGVCQYNGRTCRRLTFGFVQLFGQLKTSAQLTEN